MLRFIVKTTRVNFNAYPNDVEAYTETIDADIPALEAMLRRGGRSETGSERSDVIGVEVRRNEFFGAPHSYSPPMVRPECICHDDFPGSNKDCTAHNT